MFNFPKKAQPRRPLGEVPRDIAPYYDVIDRHLQNHPSKSDDHYKLDMNGTMAYVRTMLEDLVKIIAPQASSYQRDVIYERLRQADTSASGHTDYHRKMAFQAAEIATNIDKHPIVTPVTATLERNTALRP